MSFGFSVSDVIGVLELAYRIQKQAVAAPGQYQDILIDVQNLAFILEGIKTESSWIESNQLYEGWQGILSSCKSALEGTNKMLEDFTDLAPTKTHVSLGWRAKMQRRTHRVWKQVQWDPKDVHYHRERIIVSLTLLNGFWNKLESEKERGKSRGQMALDWISRTNHSKIQNDHFRRRLDGTGDWLLRCAQFQNWLSSKGSTLLCHGIPGAGKTTVTSLVIHYLCERYRHNATVGIAYVYCDWKRADEQTARELLGSVLKQLSQARTSVPANVRRFYDGFENYEREPSTDEISKELDTVAGLFDKVFIIIDALDECQRVELAILKARLCELRERRDTSILATSTYPEILTDFSHYSTLEIRARDDDILRVVRTRDFPDFVLQDKNFQEKIALEIAAAVDGMFLLVDFYIRALLEVRSKTAMERVLENLPSGPNACKEVYEKIITAIEREDSKQLARSVLTLVTFAKRPLLVREVQHALVTEPGVQQLDLNNLDHVQRIVSACGGLVLVDEESNVIRLVHRTVAEYLQQRQCSFDAEENLAKTCVTYLSLDVFASGRSDSDQAFERRLDMYPFFDYAARYWGLHTLAASIDDCSLVLDLLQCEQKVNACSQAMLAPREYRWKSYSQRTASNVGMMHIVAYFGLHRAMDALQPHGRATTALDSNGRTPLSWSAERGSAELASRLLRESRSNADSADHSGRTPLIWAAITGRESLVQMLHTIGKCNASWRDRSGRTAFSWAAGKGHVSLIRLLLTFLGVEADEPDEFGRTPLSWAAENGSEAVVEALIQENVSADSMDCCHRSPFSHAAENGQNAVLKLLLKTGVVDVGSKDLDKRTPLSWAAENGRDGTVKRLLELDGTAVNTRDRYGRTAISWAAQNGHTLSVKLLIETGWVEVDVQDYMGNTPLLWAAQYGRSSIVELLANFGKARVAVTDFRQRTALLWAARKGHEDVVGILLRMRSIDINSKDVDGRTALSWAAGNGHTRVVQALLCTSAIEVDHADARGRTSLSWAAENGHIAIVQMLLDCGRVNADSEDKMRRTPLSWAAESGQIPVIGLLITVGQVNVASRDNKGRTPLSYAASAGNEEVVMKLSPESTHTIPDYWARTPLSYAEYGGHGAVIGLLRSLQSD